MVDAMLLRQSAPLTVPLVIWAWNRERIAGINWLPLAIGFAGVFGHTQAQPGWTQLGGMPAGFSQHSACPCLWSPPTKLATTEPSSRILLYYFVLSLACVGPFSLNDFAGLRWQEWAAMVYVGIAIYFTLLLYTRAYAMAPAHAIAPVNYFAVVMAAFWGWLIWGQVPDGWSLVGSALVILGGLITIYLAKSAFSRSAASI